ncbi:hypothetical protein DU508_23480 [Pedobacter chinensis]|uniref:Uncharacterized protein n=1 Tax=Pedobacter chinensis TaxID=2282421 RepID=A0A369PT30_9SPHI|nr:hypothetical protein DU508_23480 [Pedobacter chinensis]
MGHEGKLPSLFKEGGVKGGALAGVVLLCALVLSSLQVSVMTKQSVLPMSFLNFLAAGKAPTFFLIKR